MRRATGVGRAASRTVFAGALFVSVSSLVLAGCGASGEQGTVDRPRARAQAVVDSATAAGTPTPGETSALPRSKPDAAGRFRLSGNEPFWGVRIDASGLTYSSPDYQQGIAFPSSAPQQAGSALRWVALTPPPEAHTLEVTLEEKRCQDTMADKSWTHTATVVFDGTTLTGCGERVTK